MKLKNPNESPSVGFTFLYQSDATKETVPVKGASSVSQLTKLVEASMRKNKTPIPPDLAKIIEHQICLRSPNPMEECWSGGIGDTLHHRYVKPFLTVVEGKSKKMGALGRVIAGAAKALKGCGGCSGTKLYKTGVNNLGRAGTLNKVFNRK